MALNEYPAEYQKLRDDSSLGPSMVPEIIRYVPPVIHMRRIAKEDAELGGNEIGKGDKFVMWYVSGNRDPEAIESRMISLSTGRGHASACRSGLASIAASATA